MAARLIAQLPSKDSGGFRVSSYKRFHVRFVCLLCGGIGIECGGIAAKRDGVGVDAAVIVPVVHKIEDELHAIFLSR